MDKLVKSGLSRGFHGHFAACQLVNGWHVTLTDSYGNCHVFTEAMPFDEANAMATALQGRYDAAAARQEKPIDHGHWQKRMEA